MPLHAEASSTAAHSAHCMHIYARVIHRRAAYRIRQIPISQSRLLSNGHAARKSEQIHLLVAVRVITAPSIFRQMRQRSNDISSSGPHGAVFADRGYSGFEEPSRCATTVHSVSTAARMDSHEAR